MTCVAEIAVDETSFLGRRYVMINTVRITWDIRLKHRWDDGSKEGMCIGIRERVHPRKT